MTSNKHFAARWLGVAVLGFAGLFATGAAISQSSNPVDIYKNLPKSQQDSILQTFGKGGSGSGKTSDSNLNMPDTVQPKLDENTTLDENGQRIRLKTRDGRYLRIANENPELRANDTVLIELISKYDRAKQQEEQQKRDKKVADVKASKQALGSANPLVLQQQGQQNDLDPKVLVDHRTDDEKKKSEELQKRVAKYNPYQLNRFGVLEIPGLQAMPLAGLTAEEATERLNADPDLVDFDVKVTLLRLEQFGDEALKPFGYDLFEGAPSTFAPVTDIPVPGDYVVGPGDVIDIQLYGNDPSTDSLTVSRDGRINFPKLGPIVVGGMSFDRARATIESRVKQQLIGTRISISMSDLRTIRVFVLGEAQKPGSYLVSGLSTMTNALFVSGGVKKIGSLRKIQLKRSGRLVTELDLYDLLLRGDTSADRVLQPGDVIFIPPVGNTVSVDGEVRRPAIYEVKQEKNVGDVIQLAGGLTPEADSKLAHLERITSTGLRVTRGIDLNSAQLATEAVVNGDKIRIAQIRPTLENSVTLSGHVFRPGAFEYREGMRISDVVGGFNELRPNADRHYLMIQRQTLPDLKLSFTSADLEQALSTRGSEADVLLNPRDHVFVFDLSNDRARIIDPLLNELEHQATLDNPTLVVNVGGRVKAPGKYPLESAMRVSDLIRAGGSLEDAAYGGEAELTRYEVINGQARQTELLRIDLNAVRHGDPKANVALRPYDYLLIKETPAWEDQATIEVTGEVRFPGKYPIQRGETLHSVLERAGGMTDLSFSQGTVFTREVLKDREMEQIELLSNRFQSDLTSLSLQAIANTNGGATAGQALLVGQQLIEQLRETKPVGRLVVDIDQVMKVKTGGQGDVLLKDGDKLVVPKKTQEITVIGEVQSPTSHILNPGFTRDDYIAQSGGLTAKADKRRIYVVRANGSVLSNERKGWFRRGTSLGIQPGDTIVVPLDAERIRPLPLWTAVTTIIYNLAIAAAAVSRF